MDIREFVKKRVAEGEKQVSIAKKTGVSQGTIYKLLYTDTKPTMDIIMKIAHGYDIPFDNFIVSEKQTTYSAQSNLNDKELRLIKAFRNLTDSGQDHILTTIDYMVSALRASKKSEVTGGGLMNMNCEL